MNRAFQLNSFITYFLNAIDRYSIHSPFVFDLYNEVLRSSTETEDFESIERVRKELKKTKKAIQLEDKGTGTRRQRYISEIAKTSLTKPANSRLLYRLCKFINAGTTLELGTSLGVNSVYLAKGSEKLVTMEGSQAIADIARQTFERLGQNNINLIVTDINESLKRTLDNIDQLDLAFVDANHSYEATLNYFELIRKKSHDETVIVFDDIYWSSSMNRAWKEISNDPQVTLSLDLFQFGVVFLNPEFRKQAFTLWFRPW